MSDAKGPRKGAFTYDQNYGSINGTVASSSSRRPARPRPLLSEQTSSSRWTRSFATGLGQAQGPGRNARSRPWRPGQRRPRPRYREKDLALIKAKKLRAELLSKGYSVVMTRDDDKFPISRTAPTTAGRSSPTSTCRSTATPPATKRNRHRDLLPDPRKAPSTGTASPATTPIAETPSTRTTTAWPTRSSPR
jgi:hypothetical protein